MTDAIVKSSAETLSDKSQDEEMDESGEDAEVRNGGPSYREIICRC